MMLSQPLSAYALKATSCMRKTTHHLRQITWVATMKYCRTGSWVAYDRWVARNQTFSLLLLKCEIHPGTITKNIISMGWNSQVTSRCDYKSDTGEDEIITNASWCIIILVYWCIISCATFSINSIFLFFFPFLTQVFMYYHIQTETGCWSLLTGTLENAHLKLESHLAEQN